MGSPSSVDLQHHRVGLSARAHRHHAVTVRTRGEPDAVVLEVHNEGEPIPPQVLTHLFEPMRRGGQSDRVAAASGWGSIVDHVVRAHGGTIDVRSRAPEGTTFSVRLPRLLS